MPDELRVSEVPGDVASAVALVTSALQARGVRLFATVDHAAAARVAGLELADEVLLLFGNPAVGTALMQADPMAGYDLPLRMLVWSQAGTTQVAYQDPAALGGRYALDGEQATLEALRGLLEHLVIEAGERPGEVAGPVSSRRGVRFTPVAHVRPGPGTGVTMAR